MSSETATATAPANPFGGAIPILRVESLRAALHYYVESLGFNIVWEHKELFACVSRLQCRIFLSQGDQGNTGGWVWIGVADASTLEAEYRASGAQIRHRPTNYPWAFEMQVEDPDGNVLRFGSDPKTDEPYGDWLDENGRLWPSKPDA